MTTVFYTTVLLEFRTHFVRKSDGKVEKGLAIIIFCLETET